VLFLVVSVLNAARGLLAGYSPRYWGLELIALLAVESAILVANVFNPERDLRLAMVGIIGVGFAAAIRGFAAFMVERSHTVATYTVAVPGIVGLLLVNLGLRARTRGGAFVWVVLSMPLFVHQLITFGRGLWTGCFAGLAVSLLIFGGIGRGSGARWGRAGLVVAILIGLGLVGALQAAVIFGQSDLLTEAGTRLTSITSTKSGLETRSNMIRLWEYGTVINLIKRAPWFGYGIGFTFLGKEPFSGKIFYQWGVHQNFLLVWLKQGLVGLILFVWMLSAAVALGVREARRRADPWESAWFASIAVSTVFLAVFSLSNYPFAVVNETFLLALLWGGGMAMTRTGFIDFRWSPPQEGPSGQPPRGGA
jgi:O-antigen ligase